MATSLTDINTYEINGYRMTAHQRGAARTFGRAGYVVAGTCLDAIVLRRVGIVDRKADWVEIAPDGRVIREHAR